jgi:hypothetical protein
MNRYTHSVANLTRDVCRDCRQPLQDGDEVVYSAGISARRYWHRKCFEQSLSSSKSWQLKRVKRN